MTTPKVKRRKKSMRRAPGEGGLFQRADGMWVGRVDLPPGPDGKRRRKTVYSRDRAKAAEKLREAHNDVADGIAVSNAGTVGAWLDRWLGMQGHVRPSTYVFYERAVRLYAKPFVGRKQLDKLTSEDVHDMISALHEAGSTRNAQKGYQVLRMALDEAVRHRKIKHNVAAVVRKPGHVPQKRAGLSSEVARHIIKTAIELDEQTPKGALLATRWAAAFFTGARQGELLGLTWDRVDFDRGVLDLAYQLQQLQQRHGCGVRTEHGWPCGVSRPGWCPERKWDMPAGFEYEVVHRSLAWTRPKSQSGTRVVPMAPPLQAMLLTFAEQTNEEPNPHNLVWHYRDGRPINPRDDYAEWRRLMLAAGVTEGKETMPLHIARHTTARLLLEAGVDPHVVRDMIGHSDIVTTQGYQFVDLTLSRAAMGRLSELLQGGPS